MQPYFVYDSRLTGTSQHGVLWKGGEYEEESGWVPVFAELSVERRERLGPRELGRDALMGTIGAAAWCRARTRRSAGRATWS